jgi:hypothetical protein
MLLEDLRNTREDLERLEQAIAERSLEDPKHVSFIFCISAISYSCAAVHWNLNYCPANMCS